MNTLTAGRQQIFFFSSLWNFESSGIVWLILPSALNINRLNYRLRRFLHKSNRTAGCVLYAHPSHLSVAYLFQLVRTFGKFLICQSCVFWQPTFLSSTFLLTFVSLKKTLKIVLVLNDSCKVAFTDNKQKLNKVFCWTSCLNNEQLRTSLEKKSTLCMLIETT